MSSTVRKDGIRIEDVKHSLEVAPIESKIRKPFKMVSSYIKHQKILIRISNGA